MATLRGEQGAVQFDAAGSSNATIVGTRSWSLSTTKETLDTTKQGDTFRSFVGSMVSGSGTVELVYDPDATGQAAWDPLPIVSRIMRPRILMFDRLSSISFNAVVYHS